MSQQFIDHTYWMTNEYKIEMFLRSVEESEETNEEIEPPFKNLEMLTTDALVALTRSSSAHVIQSIRSKHLNHRRISSSQRKVLIKHIYANSTELKTNFHSELENQLLNGLQRRYISRQGTKANG